ncbi:Kynurenine formamidase [Pleurostoma richardsiae]|uniref:Kynurenine formamidase n=1 Tax=Pleurostoma richardsiae TaxID=41990 RepID=A0AA38R528_9PEZI|nr:Kynurenine formamidase [Pleurostoma richardsiae]
MAEGLRQTQLQYASGNTLQNLLVWEFPDPPREEPGKPQYWIIYIHGGAWRDPRTDAASFIPTITSLLSSSPSPSSSRRIAGFASLNYRLSPHPSYPQDPAATPPRDLRAAAHPDHIRDVRAGIALLQRRFGFGSRYLLAGHSAGATLALQVPMGAAFAAGGDDGSPAAEVVPPAAVVGLEGIYDMPALDARMGGEYRPLFARAFGDDEAAWAEASPARFGGRFGEALGGGLVVLAWSPGDELIDAGEIDSMERRLREEEEKGLSVVALRDLKGLHDEIVEKGSEVARVLKQTIEELDKLGR